MFLGHLPDRRGAQGIRNIGPGTFLVIDEASRGGEPRLAAAVACAQ
jgi:hypothetical protein